MEIALTGNSNSGKTCYLGALHARYQRFQTYRLLDDDDIIDNAANRGLTEQTLFAITGYKYENDKRLLDEIVEPPLKKTPIRFPPRTDFSNDFPIFVDFGRYAVDTDINKGGRCITTRSKMLSLIDIPGEHFKSEMDKDSEAQSSRTQARGAQAIILMVDTDDITNIGSLDENSPVESASYSAVKDNIIEIARGAANLLTEGKALLPIAVVPTKFDKLMHGIPLEQINALHDALFEDIVINISQIDPKILCMYCPISIVSQRKTLDPWCCEHPFLFSALGIIYGQMEEKRLSAIKHRGTERDWKEKENDAHEEFARDPVTRIWNVVVNDAPTAATLERRASIAKQNAENDESEADKDKKLAQSIASSFSIDHMTGKAPLRFAQQGHAISLRQLRGVLA